MGDVKRYSYDDLKAKQEADGSSSELHRRPAAPSQEPMQPHSKGLEAELSSVWSIMKNVNATGLTFSGSGDSSSSITAGGGSIIAQGGTLPGLSAASRTNYYSRYGGATKANQLAAGKRPLGEEALTTAIDAGSSPMRFPVQSPQPVHGAGGNKPTMAPKDEWRSFRTK